MKTTRNLQLALLGSATVLAVMLGVACGSDNTETPPNIVGDSGTDTSVDTTTPPADTSDSGTPTDSGADGDAPGDTTWDPDGGTCFGGTPTKNIEFLNACTTAACAKFTKTLTKLNPDGTLPALP